MATYGGDNDQARVSPLEVKRRPRVDANKTGVASIVKRLMKATSRVGVNIEHPEADKYKAAASERNTDKVNVHTPDEVKPTQRPKIVDDGKVEDLYGTGTQFTNPALPDKALKANVKKGDDSDEDFQLGVGRESVAHGKQSTPPRATNLVARLKKGRIKVDIKRGKSWKVASGDPDYEEKKFGDDPDRKPKTVGFSNTTSYDELQSKLPRRSDVMGFKKMLLDILLQKRRARLQKAVSEADKNAWGHISDHAKKNGHSESKARDTFSNWKKTGKPFDPTASKKPFDDSTVNWRVTDVDEKEPEADKDTQDKRERARTIRENTKSGKYKVHKWGEDKEADKLRQEKIDDHAAKSKAKVKWRNEEEKRLKDEAARRVRNRGGSAEAEQNARDSAGVKTEYPDTPESPRVNRDNQLRLKRRGKTGKALDDVDNKERNIRQALPTSLDQNRGTTTLPSREESPHAKRRLDTMSAKDAKGEGNRNRLKKAINQDLLDVLLGKAKYKDDPEGWAKGKKLNLTHAESVSSTGKLEADTRLANHLKTLQGGRSKPKSLPGKAVKDAVQDKQLEMFADEGKGENLPHGDDIKEPVQRGGSKKGSKAQKLIPPGGWQQNMFQNMLDKAREQGDGKGVDPTGKNPSKTLDTRNNLQILANLNTDLAKELEATYTVNGEALNKEEWNLHRIQEARLSATRTHALHLAMRTNCDCPSIEAAQIEVRKNHAFPLTTAEKPGMVMRGEPSAMYSADGKALEEDPMARKIDIRDKNDSALEADTRGVEQTQDSKGRITVAMKAEPTICSSLAVFNSILNKTEYDDKVVARQGKAKRSKRNSIANSTVDTAAQQINDTRGI